MAQNSQNGEKITKSAGNYSGRFIIRSRQFYRVILFWRFLPKEIWELCKSNVFGLNCCWFNLCIFNNFKKKNFKPLQPLSIINQPHEGFQVLKFIMIFHLFISNLYISY